MFCGFGQVASQEQPPFPGRVQAMFCGFGQVASQEQPPLADPASPPRFERPPPLCALGYLDHAPMNIWPTRSDSRIHLARQMGGRCCTSAHRAPVVEHRASEVPRIPCSVPSAFAAFLGPSAVRPFSLFCSGPPFSAGSLFLPGPPPFSAAFSAPPLGPPSGFPLFRFSWFLRPTVSSSPLAFRPRTRRAFRLAAVAPRFFRRTLVPFRELRSPQRVISRFWPRTRRAFRLAAVAPRCGTPAHRVFSVICRAPEVPRFPCSAFSAFAVSWVPRPFGPFPPFPLGPLFCVVPLPAGPPFFSCGVSAPPLGPPLGCLFPGFRGSSVLRVRLSPPSLLRGPGAPPGSPRPRRGSVRVLPSLSACSGFLQRGRRRGAFLRRPPDTSGAPAAPVSKIFSPPFEGPAGGAGGPCTRAPARPRWGKTRFGPRFAPDAGGPYGARISRHRNRSFLLLSSRLGPEMLRLHPGGCAVPTRLSGRSAHPPQAKAPPVPRPFGAARWPSDGLPPTGGGLCPGHGLRRLRAHLHPPRLGLLPGRRPHCANSGGELVQVPGPKGGGYLAIRRLIFRSGSRWSRSGTT